MSEQDLDRIADIITRLTNTEDRALVTRLAMRDLVATLIQRDAARMVLEALEGAGELGMTTAQILLRVRHLVDGPAVVAVLNGLVDEGLIIVYFDPRDHSCDGSIPIRFQLAGQAQQKPTAG